MNKLSVVQFSVCHAFPVCCLFVSRGGVLDSPVCLNAGGRYFVDVIFNKQSDDTSGSHILIDSVRKSSSVHLKAGVVQVFK